MLAATYSPVTGPWTTRSISDLVDRLLELGGWWWAWCGGRYDFLAIAEELHRRHLPVVFSMSGSQICRLQVGRLVLCDAFFLCPMSKAKAAPIAGIDAPELGWACVCAQPGEKECGGYCQIAPGMSEAKWRELEAYCVADVKVEYAILATLAAVAQQHGLQLRGTIGGTAWATAQAWLDLPDARERSSTWGRLATARYGGRVHVGRARAQRGWQYDLSGAYPAALATTPVPVGEPRELGRREAGISYRNHLPGIYRARVLVPDWMHIPPLPWRHSGRLAYPHGQLTGAWTGIELEYAESLGCAIDEVHEGIVYPDGAVVLFDQLIEAWYDARAAAGRNTALGQWWKLLCNSLTGKLGEAPEREKVVMHPKTVKWCNPASDDAKRAGCDQRRCTGGCGAFNQLDRWGTIWSAPYWRASKSSHIQWAAHLVSATRIRWHQGAIAVDDVVYGDTDSIWRKAPDALLGDDGQGELLLDPGGVMSGAPGEVGDNLGQWSIRGDWYDWHCLGPKAYRYREDAGAWIVRAAGVPHATDRAWEAMTGRDRELWQGRGVMTLKEAASASRGLFRRRFRAIGPRETDGWLGDRLLQGDGRTYPVDRGEIQKRFEGQARRGRFSGPVGFGTAPPQQGVIDSGPAESRGEHQ